MVILCHQQQSNALSCSCKLPDIFGQILTKSGPSRQFSQSPQHEISRKSF